MYNISFKKTCPSATCYAGGADLILHLPPRAVGEPSMLISVGSRPIGVSPVEARPPTMIDELSSQYSMQPCRPLIAGDLGCGRWTSLSVATTERLHFDVEINAPSFKRIFVSILDPSRIQRNGALFVSTVDRV